MNQQQTKKTVDSTIRNFKGQLPKLEGAIGALLVGQKLVWKVLFLVHDKRTIAKYEKILELKFRDVLPAETSLSHKSVAWTAVQKVTNFWKAVKGETPNIRTPEIKKD